MKLREWKCINADNVCVSVIYTPIDSTIIEASKKLIFIYGKNSCFLKLIKGKIVKKE